MPVPQDGSLAKCSCGGKITTYCSRLTSDREIRIRYMHCNQCGAIPERSKVLIPRRFSRTRIW
jgi:hypothetical protein